MTYEETKSKLEELLDIGDPDTARELVEQYNRPAIALFEDSLDNFTPKTISKHISNVAFFLNDYNTYYEACTFEDAWKNLDDFFGYYFIRKCMWSTPATIKSTAASIKKFYKCMMDYQMIEANDYNMLISIIKEHMPIWQDECESYNNFDFDEEDYFDDF